MKKNTKTSIIRAAVLVLAVVMLASFCFMAIAQVTHANRRHNPSINAAVHTSARGMATMEVTTGRLLYAQNEHARIPMASTTKILTAITVIENVKNLDEIIIVHPKSIGIEGTSIYLQKGERITPRELLYGLMLRSGNDASVALALHTSPTLPEFSALMNETARKAGATNSNFTNPHGLHQDEHLTTAYDLARISCYAMQNEIFAEIVATKNFRTVAHPDGGRVHVFQNKNRLLNSLDGCVGVKTGFTKAAGRCYVGARRANDMTVVCVVLNCGPMFPESEAIMKTAANEFTMTPIVVEGAVLDTGIATQTFAYPLRKGETLATSFADDHVVIKFQDKEVHRSPIHSIVTTDE